MNRAAGKDVVVSRAGDEIPWYSLDGVECAKKLGVDPATGLSAAEAARRLEVHGLNQLTGERQRPLWQAFLLQYRPTMQMVLVGAAVVSALIGNFSTVGMLVGVTLLNAVLGMLQENKAERSVDALKDLLVQEAHVRRDGKVIAVPANSVVPGDIILIRQGDRIPADGRLVSVANLDVEESSLTGESSPVSKTVAPINTPDVALGDRTNMLFMNTNATRGSGEMIVTATGMFTEVGGIANSLQETKEIVTPLTKQIDQLTVFVLILGGVAFVGVLAGGLLRGESFSSQFTLGVALAIGAVPVCLPAMITALLSFSTVTMAKKNAIVKRLPSVETLGSTSAICSDKTGTLTMNQMTARLLILAGARYKVTGQGYGIEGTVEHVAGRNVADLESVLLPMVLCSDATIHDGKCVGDPDEAALVVLAAKHGIGAETTRDFYPRIATLPFDSQYKLMATFHEMDGEDGRKVIRCFVKGAPERLLERSSKIRMWDATITELTDDLKAKVTTELHSIASGGLREMGVAKRDFDPGEFDPSGNLLGLVENLTMMAVIGIEDPPRREVKESIEECKEAGIRVCMITGDHAATAAAVARELGIEGEVITGIDFAKMSQEEVQARIDHIGVLARVSPQDKVLLVKSLQARGDIVAMTGDGINDAPALKAADIGVAMGIQGTDVTKEASDLVLADDNFKTIVSAVEEGRIVYDNMMKFIRLQMSNLVGFIVGFLGASTLLGFALFEPLQVLWVHFGALLFLGSSLSFDTPTPGLMRRLPRPADQRIIDLRGGAQIIFSGIMLAVAAVASRQWIMVSTNDAAVAQTMALTVFAIAQASLALSLRFPDISAFQREMFSNRSLNFAIFWNVGAMLLVTEVSLLKDLFHTAPLDARQWGVCVLLSLAILLLGEAAKPLLRLIPRAQGHRQAWTAEGTGGSPSSVSRGRGMKHGLGALLLVAGLAAVPASAQPAPGPGLSSAQTVPAAAPAPPAAVDYLFPDLGPDALVYDGKHFWFKPIFAWVFDYTSLSQDDASVTQVGTQDDTGELRAGRLGFTLRSKGRLGLEFYTTVDFQERRTREDVVFTLQDLQIRVPIGRVKVTVGKQKETIAYELLTLVLTLPQQERILLPFFPTRNIGISVAVPLDDGRMRWAAGAFNDWLETGEPFSRNSTVYTSRLTRLMWESPNKNDYLHLGVGWKSSGSDDGMMRFSGRPESNVTDKYVDSGEFAAKRAEALSLEGLVSRGRFSVLGEYFGAWVDAPERGDPFFSGYYVTGSWFVTGESRPYLRDGGTAGLVRPKRRLGAVELVAKYSRLDIRDSGIDGGVLNKWHCGVNWWASTQWKLGLSYGDADLDRDGLRGNTKMLLSRVQWLW